MTDPFVAPSVISAALHPSAPVLVSRPGLLIINSRRLRLAVRCGSPRCAVGAAVSVYAGRLHRRLPATVELGPRPGYAHVVIRVPARDRGAVRAFLLAHPHARRSIRVVLGEQGMTSTATLLLRTKHGFR